jgi:hypothetical protein
MTLETAQTNAGLTITHIHATRLMLPNTPDRATVTGGGCEAVVKELAIRNEAMVVSSLCVCIVLVCRENCFGGGKTVVKKADGGTQT